MAAFSAQDLRPVDTAPAAQVHIDPPPRGLEDRAATMALGQGRRLLSAPILEGLVRVGELALAVLAGTGTFAATIVRDAPISIGPMLAIPTLALLAVMSMQSLGCYRLAALRAPTRFGLRIAASWFVVFALALGACRLASVEGLQVWLARWALLGFAMLALERIGLGAATRYLARTGALARRTALVCGGPAAEKLLEDLADRGSEDLHILGIFDDRTDGRSPDEVAGCPKLGTVDDLVEFARAHPLDVVIFTLPISAERRLLTMLRKLWVLPVDIRLAAHMSPLTFRPRTYSYIGKVPVIDLFDRPLGEWDIVLKRVFDRLFGACCLVALSPLMLAIALAVKLDSKGPVLFRQRRYGFDGEPIEVFKFRSMFAEQLDIAAKELVTRDDPRVTRVGRIIRKTSLDGLPQLFNVVFRGDLSLVGPRPRPVDAEAAALDGTAAALAGTVDGHFARHRIRPGLTGWAQVNGWRGETDAPDAIEKRVAYDLFYIENWSIFLDLYVLAMTPVLLIKAGNRS